MSFWSRRLGSSDTAVSSPPQPGSAPRFAVVDCETTGLNPNRYHRMIELAIIEVDDLGAPGRTWSTLLNPMRDLGDAGIHGIRGRDVADAPQFADLAGSVLDRLRGRIVVAHNARFDCAFLEAELAAAGYEIAPLSRLCTIELAQLSGAGAYGFALAACCRERGIEVERTHEALTDARACEALLCAYLGAGNGSCGELVEELAAVARSREVHWPAAADTSEPLPRERGGAGAGDRGAGFLAKLADAPKGALPVGSRPVAAAYLQILDRALEDRQLSAAEAQDLLALANLYDLSRTEVEELHGSYVDALCQAALADTVVTDRERYDLKLVAEALGVGDLPSRLEVASPFSGPASSPSYGLHVSGPGEQLRGSTVCFTGQLLCAFDGKAMTRERACELAETAGLKPVPRVTKSLDLLVIADPESQSGKAKKARDYGIRIVAETRFWQMIGVEVDG